MPSGQASSAGAPLPSEGCVLGEPGVEVGEPLAVDERLEDPAHLEDRLGSSSTGRRKPSSTTLLMCVSIWSTSRASLLRVGQEHPDHLDDLLAGEHQPGVAALGVELGELLAQQREQQAHVEGQRHGAGSAAGSGWSDRRLVLGRALAEERVALGLVDDDLQAQHGHVVPDLRLQLEQLAPGPVVGVPVDDALHQLGDDERQIGAAVRWHWLRSWSCSVRAPTAWLMADGPAPRKVTGAGSATLLPPSGSSQPICSRGWSSKTTRNAASGSDR